MVVVAAAVALSTVGPASAHPYVVWLNEDTYFAVDPDHQGGQLCAGANWAFVKLWYVTDTWEGSTAAGPGDCTYPRYDAPLLRVRMCTYVEDRLAAGPSPYREVCDHWREVA